MKGPLLDLYCGQGGAAMGYHLAGWDVTGVDKEPQPRYPFRFIQDDALDYLSRWGQSYLVVHASPPCQTFVQLSRRWKGKGGKADSHIDLLTPTRKALQARGGKWVIENVVGARRAMLPSLLLHGGMFGLRVYRPRLFESSVLMMGWPKSPPPIDPIGVYGEHVGTRTLWRRSDGSVLRVASSIAEASAAMGIDWMDWHGLTQAIPPAYTRWIGERL